MKIIKQLERLKTIHHLIENQQTGSPNEFANKIHVSKRQLFNILDDLKLMGAPIEYSTLQKSYIYSEYCEIQLLFQIKILNKEEMTSISGGKNFGYYYSNFPKLTHLLLHGKDN